MSYENILWEVDGHVGILTVNRPKSMNSLNVATFKEIAMCLDREIASPDVRALVVTGAGEKAFVAGADIPEIRELNSQTGVDFSALGTGVFERIENLPIPVIAAIGGFALGGGCEFTMACHLRIASEKAKFGQPEIKLGLIPGYGGTQRLPRLVGRGRALELLLTGRMVSAAEALQIGLVNDVVPHDQVLPRAKELAAQLAAAAPLARKAMLEAVRIGADQSLHDGLQTEVKLFGYCCGTADKNEGTGAFLEKREAVFTGK